MANNEQRTDPVAVMLLILLVSAITSIGVIVTYRIVEHPSPSLANVGFVSLAIALMSLSAVIIMEASRKWNSSRNARQRTIQAGLNGIQAGATTLKTMAENTGKSSGITQNGISKADELRKWDQLRQDGLVSQEEFDKVRKELLEK